jgi:hypothetical protein
VRRLGGRLSVANGAEGGTVIEAVIPWSRQGARPEMSPMPDDVPLFAAVAHA